MTWPPSAVPGGACRVALVALVAVPSVLVLVLVPLPALAHKSSDAYIFIDVLPERSDLR